tara:strand:- start:712 stop:948 length:237 start_codon:yes stop_codon:yes gene_type:complete
MNRILAIKLAELEKQYGLDKSDLALRYSKAKADLRKNFDNNTTRVRTPIPKVLKTAISDSNIGVGKAVGTVSSITVAK